MKSVQLGTAKEFVFRADDLSYATIATVSKDGNHFGAILHFRDGSNMQLGLTQDEITRVKAVIDSDRGSS